MQEINLSKLELVYGGVAVEPAPVSDVRGRPVPVFKPVFTTEP